MAALKDKASDMSVPVSITSCLDATKQAFHDGSAILDKIKKKRALKRAPPPPRLLEESIDQAPDEIEKEKQRGLARFGKSFQEGDHIAIIQLQQVTIQLQASLLEELRNDAVTDFTYLVDAADGGRDRTIAVLHDFQQRLIHGTSREDFHSPNSSSTLSQPIPPQTVQPAQTPSEIMKHPTWQRDFSASGSNDGDATSGVDEVQEVQEVQRHRKRHSLLHFLKHTRTNSTTDAIVEEPARTNITSPMSAPFTLRLPPEDATTAARDRPNTTTSTSNNNTREARFTYEHCEDNPPEIWGPQKRPSHERRETVAVDPKNDTESFTALHRAISHSSSLSPPSQNAALRTNSMAPSFASFGAGMAAGLGGGGSVAITQPNPDNDFLGFCKSSYKLQNGDRKSSFTAHKQVEPWSRHPGAYAAAPCYLQCNAKSCAFRSNFCHTDVEVIWRQVFTSNAKGIKVRWRFLAKSHVLQKVVVKGQYSFKCLFCVFLGVAQGGGGVYHGVELYLDHINDQHRRQRLNDVVLFKTGCVADRVAEDGEEFDINLWPGHGGVNSSSPEEKKGGSDQHWLSDDLLMGDPTKSEGRDDSMFSANEPWNEGLSDFHYRGEHDRTELE